MKRSQNTQIASRIFFQVTFLAFVTLGGRLGFTNPYENSSASMLPAIGSCSSFTLGNTPISSGGNHVSGGGSDDSGDSGNSNGTGGTTGGEDNFITGAPVDIPAPLAKGDETIDPTSIGFIETGGRAQARLMARNVTVQTAQADPTVGVLHASTVDHVERDVGLVYDGSFVDFDFATNGSVSFTIPASLLGKTFALVVMSPGSTRDNIVSVSRATLVNINTAKEPFNQTSNYTVSVSITNTSATTSINPLTLTSAPLTLDSEDNVYFQATNASNQKVIQKINLNDGTDASVYSGLSATASQLEVSDQNLFLSNDGLDSFFGISLAGDLISEAGTGFAGLPEFCVSPALGADNRIARATTVLFTDGMGGIATDGSFGIYEPDLATLVPINISIPVIDSNTTTELSCAWKDPTTLVMTRKNSAGNYLLSRLYLSGFFADNSTPVAPTDLLSNDAIIKQNPAPNSPAGEEAFECGLDESQISVCITNEGVPAPNDHTVLFSEPGHVSHIQYAGSDNLIIFEYDLNSGSTDVTNHAIVAVNRNTLAVLYLAEGGYPVVSPNNDNIITYLHSVDNTLQVGVINLLELAK